ncbi:hypothetical protein J8Z24_19675 [Pseudoalteromonas sp. SCSIO 43201]|uniref:DUF6058 family natural product biosynthesis protein n=1 Tax=Pseudoalteromonas TaxID=53246 RepID=UPI00207580EC|nr:MULTISPECIES: DUF6058 family natural product biosynthesis protein [Pseudoalteromonas]MDW7548944.1 DUF6058 family natural product biosynthesis protein [Pseudoalteromonas peptidolytica]USD30356.1 hypothetical protein J8Z24_19675 [Pseudoalteromonas sp. SCSIO 43201]
MVLYQYLNTTFYTMQELLDVANISEQELKALQDSQLMPRASYTLNVNLGCDSFFGQFKENHILTFYAKGYASWLNVILEEQDQTKIYALFSARYRKTLTRLGRLGYVSSHPKLTTSLSKHIADEWQHFLDGTYGLCTQTGLPEDIAAKEFAIIKINELCQLKTLNQAERETLIFAVNLLDSVSAQFAPHERANSSRRRLVDEVRAKYRLAAESISLSALLI